MSSQLFASHLYRAIKGDLGANDAVGAASQLDAAGEIDLAIELYRAWIRHNADSPVVYAIYYNYGALLLKNQQFSDAKDALREAISRQAGFFPAYFQLGNALEYLGATQKAIECWQQVANHVRPPTEENTRYKQSAIQLIDRLQTKIKTKNTEIIKSDITQKEIVTLLGKTDPVILDIGCNEGFHTQWFVDMFAQGRVYAFEPDSRPIERYKKRVKSDRAQLFEYAISDVDGFTEFYASHGIHPERDSEVQKKIAPGGWDLSGSIKKPKTISGTIPWLKFDKSIKMQTKKLDTWANETGICQIDLIWADVQGAEAQLIRGGESTLKCTRFFYTEYCEEEFYEGQMKFTELLAMLPGFSVLRRYEHDVLLVNERLI